jgi:hypothetical protein
MTGIVESSSGNRQMEKNKPEYQKKRAKLKIQTCIVKQNEALAWAKSYSGVDIYTIDKPLSYRRRLHEIVCIQAQTTQISFSKRLVYIP